MNNNDLDYTYKYSEKEKSIENQQRIPLFFSYDPKKFNYKPSKKEAGGINNRLLNNYKIECPIYDLAALIAKGHAVSPALFVEERSSNGFYAAHMLFLDIDYGIGIEEFRKASVDYGLYPNLIYPTYNYTSEKPRFRVVYVLDRIIQNKKVYKYLLKGLGNLFPRVDSQCLEPSRLFLGTIATQIEDLENKRVIKVDDTFRYEDPDAPINSNNKSVLLCSHATNSYDHLKTVIDSTYYKPFDIHGNHIRRICNDDPSQVTCVYYNRETKKIDTKVQAKDNNPDPIQSKSDVKREELLYINSISQQTSFSSVLVNPQGIQKVEKVNFEDLADRCDIFRDFVTGEIWNKSHYRHIFNLSYNLKWVKGGLDYMLQVMERNNQLGITDYSDNEFSCVKLAKSSIYNYSPPSLYGLKDLYPGDYKRWGNIYNAARNQKRGSVLVIKDKLPTPISLNEGEKQLKQTFKKVMNKKATGCLDLISAGIGLGKTRLLIDHIQHRTSGAIIAFVTHQMKDQFVRDLEKKGCFEKVDFIVTPQIPLFNKVQHNIQLKFLFENDQFNEARRYIHLIATEQKSAEDALAAKKYLTAYNGFIDALICKKFEGTILTTHSMCHYFAFEKLSRYHRTIIFDEDLYSGGLISTDSFLLDDLKRLSLKDSKYEKEYQGLLNKDIGIYRNGIHIPNAHIEQQLKLSKSPAEKGLYKKLLELKRSKGYANITERKAGKDVYKLIYGRRISLKPCMKYIVLSGTAPEHLYRFENIKVSIHNQCKYIAHRGSLIQHTGRSYSQSSLLKSTKLPECPDGIPVITFQKHKGLFEGASQNIHFYNALGYNDLKGKDVMVVGTPHLNPYALAILALEAGIDLDLEDTDLLKKQNQTVEYNGLEFKQCTFINETLRELSMELTESELQQTVGRSRLIRHNSTVHLHSNFPLWQARAFVY